MRYVIKTYGCQMNAHESEKLEGALVNAGFEPAHCDEAADLIVFNTCCVRHTAEQTAYGNIGQTKALKRANKNLIVAVCGCMAQKKGEAEKIRKSYPYVDIVFGTHNMHMFLDYLNKKREAGGFVCEVWDKPVDVETTHPIKRVRGENAFVNIMYGCNNYCTYCIVPFVRGHERSRTPEAVFLDIESAVNDGFLQITLLGQNVNSYKSGDVGFDRLLDMAAKRFKNTKFTFMTSHPKDFNEQIASVIAQNDNIIKRVHLPMQSGSSRVLSMMNRKYTIEDYMRKIDIIRTLIPNCEISTDIIVGFPTETEEEFLQTVEAVRKIRFNNMFMFMYSVRSGTKAQEFDDLPQKIKKERIARLIDVFSSLN